MPLPCSTSSRPRGGDQLPVALLLWDSGAGCCLQADCPARQWRASMRKAWLGGAWCCLQAPAGSPLGQPPRWQKQNSNCNHGADLQGQQVVQGPKATLRRAPSRHDGRLTAAALAGLGGNEEEVDPRGMPSSWCYQVPVAMHTYCCLCQCSFRWQPGPGRQRPRLCPVTLSTLHFNSRLWSGASP